MLGPNDPQPTVTMREAYKEIMEMNEGSVFISGGGIFEGGSLMPLLAR